MQSATSPADSQNPLRERLFRRVNGLTITPRPYAVLAGVALAFLTLIVLSGAAVRLTDSGLGCPTWPRCFGHLYPPLRTHAVIEFSNRTITVPTVIAAIVAWIGALRLRPYRRDLAWISVLLPLGVLAQAILGGLTVLGKLDYGWVMGHFALSMLMILAAAALFWRSIHPPGEREPSTDRIVATFARVVFGLTALVIFMGTAATAAGPHSGGFEGQHINRLHIVGSGTMDFVIHRHAEAAFVLGIASLALWSIANQRSSDRILRRWSAILCVSMALQGLVGMVQYETKLPTELVWVHVLLACSVWISATWSMFAAGRLAPARARSRVNAGAEGAGSASPDEQQGGGPVLSPR